MKRELVELVGLAFIWLVTLALGFAIGFAVSGMRDADNIAAAHSDRDVAASTSKAQTAALTKLQSNGAAEIAKADAARANAQRAIAGRPAAHATIDRHAQARVEAVRDEAHESPDIAALGRMPVPPALAGRLWPVASASAGAPASH